MATTTIKQSADRTNEARRNPRTNPTSVITTSERPTEHNLIRRNSALSSRQPRRSSAPAIRSQDGLPTRHIATPGTRAKVKPQEQYQIAPPRTREQPGLNLSLPLLFLLSGYVVGAALVLIFGLDLLVGMPFSRITPVSDIGFLFSGAALLYLSWDARDGCRYRNLNSI